VGGLADQMSDDPVILAPLETVDGQVGHFAPAKATTHHLG